MTRMRLALAVAAALAALPACLAAAPPPPPARGAAATPGRQAVQVPKEERTDQEAALAALTAAGWPKVAAQPTDVSAWPAGAFPLTAWEYRSVESDELAGGGPPRDGIPSIDAPLFVGADAAAGWLGEQEPVAVVDMGGEVKAYPYRLLVWHEVVNDIVGGVPVAVTYCPLCFSGLAFDRRIDGVTLEFGTSGMLRLSNLVMYDRQTESLFQQLEGEAVAGILTGAVLERLPIQVLSFADAREAWPNLQVLDQKRTGYQRNYGTNPYSRYDAASSSPFMLRPDGDRWGEGLLPMARVLVVEEPGGDTLPAVGVADLAAAGVAVLPPFLFVSTGTHASSLDTQRVEEGREVAQGAVYFLPEEQGEWVLAEGVLTGPSGRFNPVNGASLSGGEGLAPARHSNHFWFAWSVFKPEVAVWAPPA